MCVVLASAGLGITMPSLSSGIVQSVPMNKSGVGSAVNDVTREVGGAIGIAGLGSVVNSIYRSHVASALRALPASAAAPARDNVAKALGVAAKLSANAGPEASRVLAGQVRQAFVDGMRVGLRIAAGVVVIGAAAVAHRIPDSGDHGSGTH
jgi:hypothetical protein